MCLQQAGDGWYKVEFDLGKASYHQSKDSPTKKDVLSSTEKELVVAYIGKEADSRQAAGIYPASVQFLPAQPLSR